MAKPTVVQSILNLPSQTYGNVETRTTKEYYSTKQEILRIAASAQAGRGEAVEGQDRSIGGAMASDLAKSAAPMTKRPEARNSSQSATRLANPPQHFRPLPEDDSDDSDLEVFFTPNTSPRTSMASSVATVKFPSSRKPSRRSLTNVTPDSHQPLQLPPTEPSTQKLSPSTTAVPSTRTPSTPSSQATRARHAVSTNSSLSSTSLDGHSVFSDDIGSGESTILTTPYQSDSGHGAAQPRPVRSTSTNTKWRNQHYTDEDWAKDSRWPLPSSTSNSPGSTTPVSSGNRSKSSVSPASTSSASAGKSVADKKSSSGSGSTKRSMDSKPQTSPQVGPGSGVETQIAASGATSSSKGKEKERMREQEKKPAPYTANQGTPLAPSTTARSGKKYVPPRQPHTFSAFASIPASESSATTSTSKSSHTLTNGHGNPKTIPNGSTPKPGSSLTTVHVQAPPAPSLLPENSDSYIPTYKYSSATAPSKPPQTNNPKPSTSTQRKKPSAPKPPPSTMMGMDALLEEDEDGPLTPRMESKTIEGQNGGWDWGSDWDGEYKDAKQGGSDAGLPGGSQGSQGTGRSRSLRHTSPNDLRRRRSRSLDGDSSSSTSTSTARKPRPPPQTLTAEVEALVQGFVSPGERPSKGTQGYTSLVLPRAPPPTSSSLAAGRVAKSKGDGWLSADGKIDLTKTGVAQTTMATVEVVRGLGSRNGSGILGIGGKLGFGRRRASSGPRHGHGPAPLPLATPVDPGARAATSANPGENGQVPHSLGIESTPLGFTSYRKPPNYVPSGGVLVQVWAVGVDGVDGRLVGVRFGGNGRNEWEEAVQTDQEMEEERAENTEHEEDEEPGQSEQETTSTKKGALAALGRSLSLRLSRGGSAKKAKQSDLQRSASAAAPSANGWSGKTKQDQGQLGNGRPPDTHKRSLSFSLKRSNTAVSQASTAASIASASASPNGKNGKEKKKDSQPKHIQADVGYIPGRSFVGRVLECGWDVRDEVARKGEWVVGLLDVRKAGALAEFIVVDRHRVRRVPHPYEGPTSNDPHASSDPVWAASPTSPGSRTPRTLTLEELALLPLCGLPAYRAVRTFMFAFSSIRDGNATPTAADRRGFDFGNGNGNATNKTAYADHEQGHRRRVLVLRGHDGAGAMAVQMLVRRGWRVSVHVPFSSVPAYAAQEVADRFMHVVEERAREWGADEVIFDDGEEGGGLDDGRGAAVRVLDTLREDGDVFDAVLDTIGGKEIREAGERLLRSQGSPGPASPQEGPSSPAKTPKRRGVGQFTTLVGDVPERTIPSAGDNFRAGLRSLRLGSNDSTGNGGNGGGNNKANEEPSDVKGHGKVGYAWVSVAQDVDWEGDDVGETLGTVVRMALEDGVRPLVEDVDITGRGSTGMPRAVSFDHTPSVFVDNGPLRDGATVVVRIAE